MKKWTVLLLILKITTLYCSELKLATEFYGLSSSSSKKTAHWIFSGKSGMIEEKENIGAVLELNGSYSGYDAGINLKAGNEDGVELKKIYVEKEWKKFVIFAGKKEYLFSNPKSELSTGSMLVSSNAEAVPRFYLGTNGYIPVKWSNNKLLISASMSNGVLEKERKCELPYLHEKELYLKFNVTQKSALYGGISHAALWGGKFNGKELSSGFSDFISVFLVNNTGESSIEGESINKIGDHKAIYEAGYERKGNRFDSTVYCQHFFEDGSGKKFQNWKDMLAGISVRDKKNGVFEEIVAEYIYTKDQSGTGVHNTTGGNDSYYDNYIYGPWTYKNMILGNSLFVTEGSGKEIRIVHSRISGVHLGVKGRLSKTWSYNTKLSLTKNFGTCSDAGKEIFEKGKKEIYSLIQLEKAEPFGIKESTLYIAAARDCGELYNNSSVGIGFQKSIELYKK